jgi:hypothetical protein
MQAKGGLGWLAVMNAATLALAGCSLLGAGTDLGPLPNEAWSTESEWARTEYIWRWSGASYDYPKGHPLHGDTTAPAADALPKERRAAIRSSAAQWGPFLSLDFSPGRIVLIAIDNKLVVPKKGKAWVDVAVLPGKHVIWAQGAGMCFVVEADLRPGQTYRLYRPRNDVMQVVDEEMGQVVAESAYVSKHGDWRTCEWESSVP